MTSVSDYDLLVHVATIYSQQTIAEKIKHPREVINRWIKGKIDHKETNWLTYKERIDLESMLPVFNKDGSKDFTFIDLFAGIGGLRKSFESAGGECVFTSEYDKYAVKTYKANFYSEHKIKGDIREITQPKTKNKKQIIKHIDSAIPDHDVLVAGFPCQPFSIAGVSKKNSLGKKHGFEDATQGSLFFDVSIIIKAKKPLAIMLENVKNLKSHDKGRTFKIIIDTLEELNYDIVDKDFGRKESDPKVINAKHFVPQNRERLVIVAFRKDCVKAEKMSLRDITKFYPALTPKVSDVLDKEKFVDKKYILTSKLWAYLRKYADKHRIAGNGFGYSLTRSEDQATRTLSARYYKDGSEILIDRGPRKRPRRLTPRECSKLMGFAHNDNEGFIIPVSDTQAYKQFGNSVVVPLFSAVAQLMRPHIINAKKMRKI